MPTDRALRAEPALSLALLRVVVPLLMLLSPGFTAGVAVAGWEPARWSVPEGLGWFVALVPINESWARGAQAIVLFAAVLAALGVYARAALALLSVTAFYLFAIAQLAGFVWHDMHLLWFALVLAASPCADVLAWDATRPLDTTHSRYALPLWTVRVLLGVIYFFPGLHKLRESGLDWALGDNLLNQLHWKWAQHGVVPSLRIDRAPWLLKTGGVFVLLFELGFLPLLFWRRARPWLALTGLSFHLLSEWVFRIPFASLWLCYAVLIDPRAALLRAGAWLTRWRRTPGRARADVVEAPPKESARRRGVLWATATLLVLGATIQGARGQMRSYPLACYPTFQWRVGALMPDLGLEVVLADGTARPLQHARSRSGYRSQRQWAELWSLAGVYGSVSVERLTAYVRALPRSTLKGAVSVRAYRDRISVRPEHWGAPPVQRKLIATVALER